MTGADAELYAHEVGAHQSIVEHANRDRERVVLRATEDGMHWIMHTLNCSDGPMWMALCGPRAGEFGAQIVRSMERDQPITPGTRRDYDPENLPWPAAKQDSN